MEILAYLLTKEAEEARDKSYANYKDMLFAHAVVNQNPDLFFKLFADELGIEDEDEGFYVPENVEELHELMAEFLEIPGIAPRSFEPMPLVE